MRETNAGALKYEGADGETATLTVEARDTNHSVNYTLDGDTRTLPAGQAISFRLRRKPGDAPVILKVVFDYSTPAGGSYRMVLTDVEGYPNGESARVWVQRGTLPDARTYSFFAV